MLPTFTPSILIADDLDVALLGQKTALKQHCPDCLIRTADTPEQAHAIVQEQKPSLAIIGFGYAAHDNSESIALCRDIRRDLPQTSLICYTYRHNLFDLSTLMDLNVNAIVAKADGLDALLQAFDAVANNNRYYGQNILRIFPNTFNSAEPEYSLQNRLTKRQRTIVELIAQAKNNAEIAELLTISPKTVEGHITMIACNLGIEKNDRVKILHRLGRLI